MVPWNATKAKVQLRLSVQRLRTSQEKKEAQAKASRREIATLLERGKVETARIKVENIINEDIHLELLELLELYCELLIARFGILDQNTPQPDPAIAEGVCSIIHAAPRTEIKELHILRDLLMHKYGREFSVAVMENRDGCVSERVMKKIVVDMPSAALVDAYLSEIAKGYNIDWSPPKPDIAVDDGDNDGDAKEAIKNADLEVPTVSKEELPAVAKLPDLPPTEDDDGGKRPAKTSTLQEDEFLALKKRFDALKKR